MCRALHSINHYVKAATATVAGGLIATTGGALAGAATTQAGKFAAGLYTAATKTLVQWGLNQSSHDD